MLHFDDKNLKKLRGFLISKGIVARPNGTIVCNDPRLRMIVSDRELVWVGMTEACLFTHTLELLLQAAGMDLTAILSAHDVFEPPPKPTTCPKCGNLFTPGDDPGAGLGRGELWPQW
jgi:hypothetical protein